jgi:hypothetical protein
MKALSNGLVFDTENSTLVVEHVSKEYGTSKIYRTDKGNYFIHYIRLEENDSIEYLKNGVSDVDEFIEEWNSEFEEQAVVKFEEFEIG